MKENTLLSVWAKHLNPSCIVLLVVLVVLQMLMFKLKYLPALPACEAQCVNGNTTSSTWSVTTECDSMKDPYDMAHFNLNLE